MKRSLLASGVLCAFLLFPGPSFGEVRGQAQGLFWLDVPQEWLWTQEKGQVVLSELNGSGRIEIRFEKVEGFEGSARDLVSEARDDRRREVADRHGKSVMRIERRVDGVFALQTGFLISTDRGIQQATSIVFFHKGYLFDVYFEAPREVFRIEMERIVDTWSFEKPEEPQEDDETQENGSI